MAEKEVSINRAGNAVMLQLGVWQDRSLEDHGKPVAVLDTASDADLGKAVRRMLATRVRTKKEKKEAAE